MFRFPYFQVAFSMGLEVDATIWVVWLVSHAGDANLEGDGRRRIVPVCRTYKDHSPTPDGSSRGICQLNIKLELGQPGPHAIAIASDRDLCAVSKLIPLYLVLHNLRYC